MALGGTMLGVVLDLIGILFSTSGNLLMRWVANRDEKRLIHDPNYKKRKEYLDPLWYLIVILLFGNGAIDFAAFQFATMAILAPLASVSIVLNSIVAYFLLGEKFTFMHGVGSCIMIGGATLTIITGPPEAEHQVTVYHVWQYFSNERYLIFLGCKAILLALCVLYINFVPVVELQKHPTKKALLEAEAHKEVIAKRTQVVIPPASNIVTIHEDGTMEGVQEEELRVRTSHNSEEPTTSPKNPPKTPDSSDGNCHSRNNSSSPLVREQCQCPSTPRVVLEDMPDTSTKSIAGEDPLRDPIVNRPLWQRFLYTQGHVVIWSFLVSGVGSYTNLTGKIFVKLISTSSEGNMQFTHWGAYIMAVLLIISAVMQLHLMKIALAKFESIVIMPSLNCMYILHLMCEGGMFFDEFGRFESELYKGLFALSIIIAFVGIAVASKVKEQTLDAQPEKGTLATELDILVSAPKASPTPIPVQ